MSRYSAAPKICTVLWFKPVRLHVCSMWCTLKVGHLLLWAKGSAVWTRLKADFPPENLQKYGCCFHSWGEQCNLCRLNWELNCVCSGYVIAVPRNRSERFPLEDKKKKKACVMQIPHTWFQFRLELSASGTDLTDGTHTHKKKHNVGFSGWQKRQWLNLVTQEGQNQAGMWQSHVTKMWEVLILSCLTAKFQR